MLAGMFHIPAEALGGPAARARQRGQGGGKDEDQDLFRCRFHWGIRCGVVAAIHEALTTPQAKKKNLKTTISMQVVITLILVIKSMTHKMWTLLQLSTIGGYQKTLGHVTVELVVFFVTIMKVYPQEAKLTLKIQERKKVKDN